MSCVQGWAILKIVNGSVGSGAPRRQKTVNYYCYYYCHYAYIIYLMYGSVDVLVFSKCTHIAFFNLMHTRVLHYVVYLRAFIYIVIGTLSVYSSCRTPSRLAGDSFPRTVAIRP